MQTVHLWRARSGGRLFAAINPAGVKRRFREWLCSIFGCHTFCVHYEDCEL